MRRGRPSPGGRSNVRITIEGMTATSIPSTPLYSVGNRSGAASIARAAIILSRTNERGPVDFRSVGITTSPMGMQGPFGALESVLDRPLNESSGRENGPGCRRRVSGCGRRKNRRQRREKRCRHRISRCLPRGFRCRQRGSRGGQRVLRGRPPIKRCRHPDAFCNPSPAPSIDSDSSGRILSAVHWNLRTVGTGCR